MNAEAFLEALVSITPLSRAFSDAFHREVVALSLPRNHILQEAPKVAEYVYFIESGFAMTYTFVEGKKMAEAFWRPGQLIVSPTSFFEQVPCAEYIQLMEKSDLSCITHDGMEKLLELSPEFSRILLITVSRYYEASRQRLRDMQRLSAGDRLEKLLVDFAEIEQLVPQDNIASYLGITPQSLSRLKRLKSRL